MRELFQLINEYPGTSFALAFFIYTILEVIVSAFKRKQS